MLKQQTPTNHRKSIINYFLAALIVVSTNAQAESGWVDILYDVNYSGEVTYSNAGSTYSYAYENDDYQSIISKAAQIQALENTISAKLKAAIQQAIYGELSLRNFSFSLTGPIKLVLTGRPDGSVNARFGGFGLHASGKLRKNSLLYAHFALDTDIIWMTGDYDIHTGKISNISPEGNWNVDFDVDIDSILDFIPLFNTLITQSFESDLEAEALLIISSHINASSSYENMVFGLNEILPSGIYVFDGIDLAQLVKDEFISLISGESIAITLTESMRTFRTSSGYYSSYMMDNISINISDHLFIDFTETPIFHRRWVCFNQPCDIIP